MVLKPDGSRSCSRDRGPAPILAFDGDKGGVGKSFLARVQAYIVSSIGLDWVGFDLDTRNAHLTRFHQNMDVTRFDWTQPAAWDQLYGQIMQTDASKVVLIDLPAQAGQVLSREYPRLLATTRHAGRPLLRTWCLSRSFDSVNLLSQSLGSVPLGDTFVVKNLRDGRANQFDLWDNSRTRESFLSGGGTELCLPALPTGVADAIEATDISFIDARSRITEPWFLYDLESFLQDVNSAFAPVIGRLA